ncbi:MAG: MBL fold metallo-hydrolase [Actinomycetota bacterium]|nr:MBL fold metallo-hydrolase [Actinomycetota bacterium]
MGGPVTFRVTVLGSSARFATRERACSGYLLEIDGHKLWLDAGAGTWQNLLRHCRFEDLEGVVLTHRHPDHATDVYQLQHALLFGPGGRLPEIPLWAPAETIDLLSAYDDLSDAFVTTAVAGGSSMTFGEATIRFFSMAHPPETVGVRVESAAGVLAYSADSGEGADFRGLAGDAALFLCEASNQDSDELWEGHLRAAQAGRIAREAGVRRLVLTHLPVDRDLEQSLAQARREAGDVPVELAADGAVYEVGA